MAQSLRILILEDNPADAELIQFELEEAKLAFTAKVAADEKDFIRELREFSPDLILSDYDLPRYNGALALAEARRRCPDTPFILVTGAVTEDRAIEILTQGAKDYVLKNRLEQRLVPAVLRALAEAEEYRARKQAEAELREAHRTLEERVKIRTAELEAEITSRRKTEEALRDSKERQRLVLQASSIGTFEVDLLTGEGEWNATEFELLGLKPGDVEARPDTFFRFVHPDDVERLRNEWEEATQTGKFDAEFRIARADGRERWLAGKGRFIFDGHPDGGDTGTSGKPRRFMGVNFDITGRKQAEEEARKLLEVISEEKEKLAALIDNIQDEIWFADAHKRFTLANPAALKEFHLGPDNGVSVEELAASLEVYRPDGSLRPVEEAPPLRALGGEVVRDQEEMVRTPATGELRHRQVSSNPVRNADGQIIGSVSVVRDITERKRGEEAINRSQKTFHDLVERSPFGTYIVDAQFRIAMMNAASQDGAFRNARPVIGRDFAEAMHILWPKPVAAEIIGHFRHTLDTGEPYYSQDFINPRHDAETVEAYEWELHRMTLPDGQHGVICYYYDSTKLREADAALRESEERYRAVVENTTAVILRIDPAGIITFANRRALDFFGYSAEELIGKHAVGTIVPPRETTGRDLAKMVDQIAADPDAFHTNANENLCKNGRRVWLEWTNSGVYGADGRLKEFLSVGIDAMARKQAEEALLAIEERERERGGIGSVPKR